MISICCNFYYVDLEIPRFQQRCASSRDKWTNGVKAWVHNLSWPEVHGLNSLICYFVFSYVHLLYIMKYHYLNPIKIISRSNSR